MDGASSGAQRAGHSASSWNREAGSATWLWEPIDAEGRPIRDEHNPAKAARSTDSRTLAARRLSTRRQRVVNEEAMEGPIYNPENGRTYRASLRLRSPDILEVKGYVLIVCDTQVWRRVE
jgi:hypothetical protein